MWRRGGGRYKQEGSWEAHTGAQVSGAMAHTSVVGENARGRGRFSSENHFLTEGKMGPEQMENGGQTWKTASKL